MLLQSKNECGSGTISLSYFLVLCAKVHRPLAVLMSCSAFLLTDSGWHGLVGRKCVNIHSVTFTCPATTGWSPCPGRCSTDEAPKNTNTNYLIYSHPNLVNTSYVFLLATEFSLFVVLAFTVLSESVGKKRRKKKKRIPY